MKHIDTSKLSQGYIAPDIATKQRVIVDRQLQEMREGNAPAHFAVVGSILSNLRRRFDSASVTLLDAGASSCYYSEIIEHYVPGWIEYTGLDYSPSMVRLAREYYPDLSVIEADMQNLDFPDAAFDIVLCGGTVKHIEDWKWAISELVRVARRAFIWHRAWVYTDNRPTFAFIGDAYGQDVLYRYFNERELLDAVSWQLASAQYGGEGRRHGTKLIRTYVFVP